ncbi:phytase [Gilvimarinus algae]|uniref:Phytase n=1 Tax=Gilvimarinus algae TaxID=3058037 RepID=A0ABT8T9W3_9GAMM|nr:phytase [Gilvimarinus sp. SDUM040014]MDO3380778.1 phytase [Gilvimarinus sp. SDUM040014]
MSVRTIAAIVALGLGQSACAANTVDFSEAQAGAVALDANHAPGLWVSVNASGELRLAGGEVLAQQVELVDALALEQGYLVAATVGLEATPSFYLVNQKGASGRQVARLPVPGFLPEALCLDRDANGDVSAFIVDERGRAEHWLVYSESHTVQPALLRSLPIAPNTLACASDHNGHLYMAEEGVGIWQYEASAERPPGRSAVDMASPFGALDGGAEAIDTLGGHVVAVSADKQVRLYSPGAEGSWTARVLGQWPELGEAESLQVWYEPDGHRLQAMVRDDDSGHIMQGDWPLPEAVSFSSAANHSVAQVKPSLQTEPVARFGDAADDPAIWVHPTVPEQSRLLGTDKKHGLMVYDLQGKQLQLLAKGRLNNVDVRYGFDFGDGRDDIAVASQRDDNTLSVYRIDAGSGQVSHLVELPTQLSEIYGLCLYQDRAGTYAIANGKSGRFEQYLLQGTKGQVSATLSRTFAVGSQPEGCVADDARGTLFVGEEDTGVWTLSARAADAPEITLVKAVDAELVADVEGLALYPASDSRYLIVSSQGDDTYLVLQSQAPYKVLGKFAVRNNLALGIDAISETDGLEVTHRSLGKGFESGAFVAQDGHNVMPEQPQNFKMVSWKDIARELGLDE